MHPVQRPDDLSALASLLFTANREAHSRDLHTAGLATVDELQSELSSVQEAERLLALLGEGAGVAAELHHDTGRAWLWGPAATPHTAEALGAALRALLDALPPEIVRLSAFVAQENTAVQAAFSQAGMQLGKQVLVYCAPRAAWRPSAVGGVRLATPADADAVCALHEREFPKSYLSSKEMLATGTGAHPAKRLLVAEEAGACAGYVFAQVQSDGTGYIDYLATAPSARGRGLGGQLLRAALAWLFGTHEVEEVHLTVSAVNVQARSLYGRAGFALASTGQTADWFRAGEPAD